MVDKIAQNTRMGWNSALAFDRLRAQTNDGDGFAAAVLDVFTEFRDIFTASSDDSPSLIIRDDLSWFRAGEENWSRVILEAYNGNPASAGWTHSALLADVENQMLQLNRGVLTPGEHTRYDAILRDVQDLLNDIRTGRPLKIDRRPELAESKAAFCSRNNIWFCRYKSFPEMAAVGGPIARFVTTDEPFAPPASFDIMTATNPDQLIQSWGRMIRSIEAQPAPRGHFYYEIRSSSADPRNIRIVALDQLPAQINNRFLVIDTSSPDFKNDFDTDVANIIQKNVRWIILSPNVWTAFKTSTGSRPVEVGGLFVGSGIVVVSSLTERNAPPISLADRQDVIWHETTHARQAYLCLPTLEEEYRAYNNVLLTDEEWQNPARPLTPSEQVASTANIYRQARFGDLFSNVYPAQYIYAGSLLEGGLRYKDIKAAQSKLAPDEVSTSHMGIALYVAEIALSSKNVHQKELELLGLYMSSKEGPTDLHKFQAFNAVQALAWLLPNKYDRPPIERNMLQSLEQPVVADISYAAYEPSDSRRKALFHQYVRDMGISLRTLLETAESEIIDHAWVHTELKSHGKKYVYTDVAARAWTHPLIYDMGDEDGHLARIVAERNAILNSPPVGTDVAASAWDTPWIYGMDVKDGDLAQIVAAHNAIMKYPPVGEHSQNEMTVLVLQDNGEWSFSESTPQIKSGSASEDFFLEMPMGLREWPYYNIVVLTGPAGILRELSDKKSDPNFLQALPADAKVMLFTAPSTDYYPSIQKHAIPMGKLSKADFELVKQRAAVR